MARKTKTQVAKEAAEELNAPVVEMPLSEPEEKPLSPQEQLEAMRLYVKSMEKTEGHSNENVRDIIEAVYKRFLVVLNYSPLAKSPDMKDIKVKFKDILTEEMDRYKDEEVK